MDLNSEKPQYLKLTLEQIQLLALQQKSGKFYQQLQVNIPIKIDHAPSVQKLVSVVLEMLRHENIVSGG